MKKNILVTSAGRRVELVQAFIEQSSVLLTDSHVHATDLNPGLSAACQIAHQHTSSPRVTDAAYPEFLFDYCQNNNIGLVVPTIDTELKVLATHKDEFESHGIHLIISSLDLVSACRDKRKTGELFKQYEIKYPEIYNPDDLKFPCFAKPYDGSCSIGAKQINDEESLDSTTLSDPSMLFMQLIDKSYHEYTIDGYFDKNSRLKCLVPRKRLEVRAGEVSKGITKIDFVYEALMQKLESMDGAIGCLTIQVFVNDEKQDYVGLEINPRFGGGYPLSYAAGANYPGWLIKEYLLGEEIPYYDSWSKNLMMLRYDAKVLVKNAEY